MGIDRRVATNNGSVFAEKSPAQEKILMNSDKARQSAERLFKKEERAQDGRKAMIEYQSQARATRERTARLRELRLAKEAQARSIIAL